MRPKGVGNKIPGAVKENIVAVFTRLGGTAAMADWARENRTEFYRFYCRLAPVEHAGTVNVNHTADTKDELVSRGAQFGIPPELLFGQQHSNAEH